MTSQRTFILRTPEIRQRAAQYVLRDAADDWVVVCKPETRNGEQNAKFHAICSDLEKSGLEWAGKPRKAGSWKVLIVSAHAKATEEEFDIVPGLEGEFVNLRESTALMSVKRSASLITYALAFCDMHGVKTL